MYWSYKNFNSDLFKEMLTEKLNNMNEPIPYALLYSSVISILDKLAPNEKNEKNC